MPFPTTPPPEPGLFLRLALALGRLALPPLPGEELFCGFRGFINPIFIWEFPMIRVPYFVVLIVRILLFRVL